MISVSKKMALFTVALVLCLGLAAPSSAQNFTVLNDEYSIDYEAMTLKIFITNRYSSPTDTNQQKAKEKFYDFIVNLNMEDSDKKLKSVLAARPMLDAKVKAGIGDHLKYRGNSTIERGKLYLMSYTLDLKAIKGIVPEMELPSSSK